jgi:hypothetical protein
MNHGCSCPWGPGYHSSYCDVWRCGSESAEDEASRSHDDAEPAAQPAPSVDSEPKATDD